MRTRNTVLMLLCVLLLVASLFFVVNRRQSIKEEQGPFPAVAWTYPVVVNGQTVQMQYIKVHVAGDGEYATMVSGSEWMHLHLNGIEMKVEGGTYSIGTGDERVSGSYYGGSTTHTLVSGVVTFSKSGVSVHFVDQFGTQINWDMTIPQSENSTSPQMNL